LRDTTSGAVTKPRPVRGFVVFKCLVYALLALNVALYAGHGTATEVLDTAAWLVLLLLFEWETGGWAMSPGQRVFVHGLRMVAAAAVVWACASYAIEREWLDFANAVTWLAVVLALELEVRVAARRRVFHRVRHAVAWGLYFALAGFAGTWLVLGVANTDGAWLDAWDALLWLAAFVVIELNVFGAANAGANGPAGRDRAEASSRTGPCV
jgi:hypothetical protein